MLGISNGMLSSPHCLPVPLIREQIYISYQIAAIKGVVVMKTMILWSVINYLRETYEVLILITQ